MGTFYWLQQADGSYCKERNMQLRRTFGNCVYSLFPPFPGPGERKKKILCYIEEVWTLAPLMLEANACWQTVNKEAWHADNAALYRKRLLITSGGLLVH